MKHILMMAKQSLAVTVLVALGLSAYGCGDTASTTEPAALGNLSVSAGELQPPFNPGITDYTVQLSIDVSSTTITASPQVAGDTIRFDNQQTTSQTVTLDAPGAERTVNIVVTDTGTGGTSRSYRIRVTRATLAGNNSLQNLTVSPGTLTPEFDTNSLTYTVSVNSNVGGVNVTPTLSDAGATMAVNGQPAVSGQAHAVTLSPPGQNTIITILVKALNQTEKSYTITVSRGASNNNNLRSLGVSRGTLSPSFRAGTTSYTVNLSANLPSNETSITVTPTLQDTTATMTVNGQATNSGQARTISLPSPGSNTIVNIIVIAQNGSPKLYSVNIIRAALGGNNNLKSLAVSPGSLNSAFDPGDLTYSSSVSANVDSVTVTASPQDSNASATINGQRTGSRSVTLGPEGSTTAILIVVSAQNGQQKTYSVIVTRAALNGNNNLSNLTASPGTLDPAFKANVTVYKVDVNSDVTSVTVNATKADSNATISGDVSEQGRGTIQLGAQGTSTPVLITVTAPNGSAQTYRLNINRAAPSGNNNLRSLRLSPGTLQPAFRAGTESYSVDVQSNIAEVTVTTTKADPNAVISGDVPDNGQATIQLDGPGTSKNVVITVTAPNGSSRTYTVTVKRAAPSSNNSLSALSVSSGSLAPPFTPDTLAYSVGVDSTVTSVSVTATKADPNAVISGDVPNNGQANIQLDGPGTNKNISITVTAPDQSSKTYAITVNRAAASATPPSAPTAAPDLIAVDDSCLRVANECFAPTSDADNITNVKRPRFKIAQPATGETPNLYVDGNKDSSASFNSGANTLRPSSDLSDGSHTITYTLTNTGGESDPSPSLTVTINTAGPGTPN